MLSSGQIERFITDGYVRIDRAFSRELAAECRIILWRDMGCSPDDPATWTRPVIRLAGYHGEPFVKAANTRVLSSAYDQLVGPGRWAPMRGLGTFPIRFPSSEDTGDTGWHIDAGFAGGDEPQDFLSWRVNANSKGRALLALFLFSDIGAEDAPTRIRIGSHRAIARQLEPAGDAGVAVRDLDFAATADCPETVAVGAAGTVYLCHPFLVHAAQLNRGDAPRFIAQPPLLPLHCFDVHRRDATAAFPVEEAILRALRNGPV